MYRNQEGYSDPTPGAALNNIRREERQREMECLAMIGRLIPIMKWWAELADVPFDDPGPEGDLILTEDWHIFEKGTEREDIWLWFDEHHSKGVAFLLYGPKEGKT